MSNHTATLAGERPISSDEPLKLTLTDIMAIVFGFACLFALPPTFNLSGLATYGIAIPLWVIVLIWSVLLIQGMALATTATVLVRRFKYGRMPRPAEWLAIVIGMHCLSMSVPDVDMLVDFLSRLTQTSADFEVWRWGIAGISLVLSSVLFLLSRWCASGLRTVLLCVSLTLLIWGPCAVSSLQFSYFFPSLEGLGHGWTFWLIVNVVNLIGFLPLALLFGVPTVATVLARRCDRFRGLVWTEWIAMTIAFALMTILLVAVFMNGFEATSIAGITERIVEVAGLIVVLVLSRTVISSGIVARDRVCPPQNPPRFLSSWMG